MTHEICVLLINVGDRNSECIKPAVINMGNVQVIHPEGQGIIVQGLAGTIKITKHE